VSSRPVPFFTSTRFYASLISTWILNLKVLGFSLRSFCGPAMNCHGCPWSLNACPIGVMAYGSAMHAIPAMVIGAILAVGIVFGRLVCSFVCPFGLLQDVLHRIPGPKLHMWRFFRWGRYLALIFLVFLLPWIFGFGIPGFITVDKPTIDKAEDGLKVVVTSANPGTEPVADPTIELVYIAKEGGQELPDTITTTHTGVSLAPGQTLALPAVIIPNLLSTANLTARSPQAAIVPDIHPLTYYCKICPVGTLEATLPLLASSGVGSYGTSTTLKLSILLGFLIAMWFFSRPFCRSFCPLGAIYSLTNRFSLARIEADDSKCTQCKACARACPIELDLPREIGSADCIACGDCMRACPQSGIRRRFGLT
jgi:polyferredoxin